MAMQRPATGLKSEGREGEFSNLRCCASSIRGTSTTGACRLSRSSLVRCNLFTARRLLIVLKVSVLPPTIGPMPLILCLQDDAHWQGVSEAPAVVSQHVAVSVSGCLHGDAAACDRLLVGRAQKSIDEHGANIHHQPKVLLFVAGASHPLVFCSEGLLQNDVLLNARRSPSVLYPREGHSIQPGRNRSRRDPDRAPFLC